MPSDDLTTPDPCEPPANVSPPNDVEIENGSEPESTAAPEVLEDDPSLLAASFRSVGGETFVTEEEAAPPAVAEQTATSPGPEVDDASVFESPATEAGAAPAVEREEELPARRREFSARHIIAELKTVEQEVRQILEIRDTKRKRKLAGTQRWLELEEDILLWKFAGRFDEATLCRLHQLVMKRHYLYRQLHFVAGTRPTWNT